MWIYLRCVCEVVAKAGHRKEWVAEEEQKARIYMSLWLHGRLTVDGLIYPYEALQLISICTKNELKCRAFILSWKSDFWWRRHSRLPTKASHHCLSDVKVCQSIPRSGIWCWVGKLTIVAAVRFQCGHQRHVFSITRVVLSKCFTQRQWRLIGLGFWVEFDLGLR